MKMKQLILFSMCVSGSAYAACSQQVISDFTSAVKNTVYTAENVVLKDVRDEGFLIKLGEDKLYPSILDTENCLKSFAVNAAMSSCRDVFTKASDFSGMVKNGDIVASDTSGAGGGGAEVMMDAGMTAPSDIIAYYKAYKAPTTGGYYGGLGVELLERVEIVKGVEAPAEVRESDEPVGGYQDFFASITEITEKCNISSGIPTYKAPEVVDTKNAIAIVNVYKSGRQTCSFIVEVKKNAVRFPVPGPFKKCVKESDAMIAKIEQVDSDSGEIISKTVADSSTNFIGSSINDPVKVTASTENTEIVNSLLDSLDQGVIGNLGMASTIKPADINYLSLASLDKTILEIVGYCEYGVNPDDANGWNEFVEYWKSGVVADGVSADNSRNANYYWAMYFHQYQNMLFYPKLKELHSQYKRGLITKADLYNWDGKALALCSFNYPTYWNSAYLFDYIADLKLDDRSTIPSWYNAESIFPE